MLKIGLFGVGHLGKIHLKLIIELRETYEFIGFYDPSDSQANQLIEELGVKRFENPEELIDAVDCVDVVTPTIYHYEIANLALRKGKHVFVEKPITNTLDEAKSLMSLAFEAGVKVQVGHVERFNPAFRAAIEHFNRPMFIETHRLSQFNPRGTDVSVVLDLMIHDIDIILSVVNSGIKRISASGVSVVSDTPDIANARIEFDNGCVANLTASRISMKNMRKSRFFQKDAYIGVDFFEKELEVFRLETINGEPNPFDIVFDTGDNKPIKKVIFDKPELQEINAIKEELSTFAESITSNQSPIVTLEDGVSALEVAFQIIEKLKSSINVIS